MFWIVKLPVVFRRKIVCVATLHPIGFDFPFTTYIYENGPIVDEELVVSVVSLWNGRRVFTTWFNYLFGLFKITCLNVSKFCGSKLSTRWTIFSKITSSDRFFFGFFLWWELSRGSGYPKNASTVMAIATNMAKYLSAEAIIMNMKLIFWLCKYIRCYEKTILKISTLTLVVNFIIDNKLHNKYIPKYIFWLIALVSRMSFGFFPDWS